jgi:tellurite resistance protein
MFDALPLIAVLVAGADGKMDNEETKWAEESEGFTLS